MNPRVYVVLPVFNRVEETKKFISCMQRQSYRNFQVVICDDGSTDGTGEYLKSLGGNIVVVEGTGDLWWAGGINRCIEYVLDHATDDALVITINNDVILEADYISQKVNRSFEYPGAVIGSLCVYSSNPDIIETSGLVMNYKTCMSKSLVRHGTRRSQIALVSCVSVTHVPGKGVLIPVAVYRQIGLYDAVGLPHYHADTDFSLRAYERGIPVFVDFESIVYSEVNVGNMNEASKITLKGILMTFDAKRGVNGFPAYKNFALNHFQSRWLQYLFVTYMKILLGLTRRYFVSKLVCIYKRSPL